MLRTTITNSLDRLVPTLILMLISLVAFMIYGNTRYHQTSEAWQDAQHSFGTVLHLLRRPSVMDFWRMEHSYRSSEDNFDGLLLMFLLGHTIVTVWIINNFFRVIIVNEYKRVVEIYKDNDEPPGDLTSHPWPSFSPWYWMHSTSVHLQERRINNRIQGQKNRGCQALLAVQKQKQKQLMRGNGTTENLMTRVAKKSEKAQMKLGSAMSSASEVPIALAAEVKKPAVAVTQSQEVEDVRQTTKEVLWRTFGVRKARIPRRMR
jgi:hypothetical protein